MTETQYKGWCLTLSCTQDWELMKSMAECYGSSTRHLNADGLMLLQGEVVSICPCSGDNTFVYLHKRNHWWDAMVVPHMSLLMVSCPCRKNWYLFNPVPVILLLYIFTKEKDSTPVIICWQLMLSFFSNRVTAMVQNCCMTLSLEAQGLGTAPKYCLRQNSVSTRVQIGSVPGLTWVFNPDHVLWSEYCKLWNPTCRCCETWQWTRWATHFLVMMSLWSHLVCCFAFRPVNTMWVEGSANGYITSFCLASLTTQRKV